MPYRRRYPRYRHRINRSQVNRYRSRYRQRSARFRRFRRMRRRSKLTRPMTNRALTHQIRAVKRRMISAKKCYYSVCNNVLVENKVQFTKIGANGTYDGCLIDIPNLNAINPNTGLAFPDYQSREGDSLKSCVSSISGRMTIHCSGPVESTTTEPYWVALVRVRTNDSSVLTVPTPDMIWDPSDTYLAPQGPPSTPSNDLPIWRMFMPNAQYPEFGGKLFKVERLWTGLLQPQQGPVSLTTDYYELGLQNEVPAAGAVNSFTNSQPGGSPQTNTVPGAGTYGYNSTIPSVKTITFTHNMKNKIVSFDAINDRDSKGEKWYLLACGSHPQGSRKGYRVNATIKTTFYDT